MEVTINYEGFELDVKVSNFKKTDGEVEILEVYFDAVDWIDNVNELPTNEQQKFSELVVNEVIDKYLTDNR